MSMSHGLAWGLVLGVLGALVGGCNDTSRHHTPSATLQLTAQVPESESGAGEAPVAASEVVVSQGPGGDLTVDAATGEQIALSLAVSDPGERISLRLLDPPPGLIFPAVLDAVSPLETELVWEAPPDLLGLQHLVFEAWSQADPAARRQLTVTVRLVPGR